MRFWSKFVQRSLETVVSYNWLFVRDGAMEVLWWCYDGAMVVVVAEWSSSSSLYKLLVSDLTVSAAPHSSM